MLEYDRRRVLVGAAALMCAGGAVAAQPRRTVVDFGRRRLADLVPYRAGAWLGSDDRDVVPDTVDASLDRGQTITRRYVGATVEPVMLVVSYHGPESPDLKVHRPETCYLVAGFAGGAPRPISIPLSSTEQVPGVTFSARRERRVETVLYWTRVGDRFPQSLSGQRLDFFTQALEGVRADGLLLRVSTIGQDEAASRSTLLAFAAAMINDASTDGRKLLLGSGRGTAAVGHKRAT